MAELWRYTVLEWGLEQAESYQAEISRTIDLLRTYPGLGAPIYRNGKPHRRLNAGEHFIVYTKTVKQISIVRVLHSRQENKGWSR